MPRSSSSSYNLAGSVSIVKLQSLAQQFHKRILPADGVKNTIHYGTLEDDIP